MITLYDYWRSSAAYRVRIALNLKGQTYEAISINLALGAQFNSDYVEKNPQGLVPLIIENGAEISQSLAIIEYLDECYPEPAFLPKAPRDRAHVRALAQLIACDIHPVNNLRILNYLKGTLHVDEAGVTKWYQHWITQGFKALEAMVAGSAFMFGDKLTLADICLVPQMANARRFKTDLSAFPKLVEIDAVLNTNPSFVKARPENQPDTVL
jgi:maleylacetoacetate isomerase